tara:strand:+ start:79 stop:192 length:114 start_codon:yes stop_codon:yes gene_type:complete
VPAQVYDLKQKRSKANLESSLERRAQEQSSKKKLSCK